MAEAYQLVETTPVFTPLRFGLLSAATIVDTADGHWALGTVGMVDPCEVPSTVTGGPCSATGIPKSATADTPPATAAQPFAVYAWLPCSPVGHGDDLADLTARTERVLTNGEGRAVEHVFWTGQASNGEVFPHLAADGVVMADPFGAQTVELQTAAEVVTSGAPVSLLDGFALLEGALASCYGGEGVLHVPAAAVAHLARDGVVHREGAQLRTLLGNVVAAYASGNREGPDGTAPAAGQAWLYATGAVTVRRSPVKRPGTRPADFVGRAKNDTVYVAERTYVLDWDCCHLAAQVSLPGLGA